MKDSSSSADLQATHQIIQIFERSKMQADDDLDALPGIYSVIDQEGKIYKGNKRLGELLGIDHEYLTERNLSELFAPEDWERLRRDMLNTSELQINVSMKSARYVYVWNCYPVSTAARAGLPPLITVIGRDITEQIRATEKNARMAHELETAGLIQRALFPPTHSDFGASSIAGFYLSATECAGDFWYYLTIGDNLYIWVGDVEGHGVPSAMITSAVRAAISLIDKLELEPSKMLGQLSNVVSSVATDKKVMTLLIANVNLKTGDMVYANAAHEPGYVAPGPESKAQGKSITSLPFEPSAPLGSVLDFKYAEYKVKLNRGDRVILFTDGIFDVANGQGQKWARMSFWRTLEPLLGPPRGALALVLRIKSSVADFRQGTELLDDVTFVAFQF